MMDALGMGALARKPAAAAPAAADPATQHLVDCALQGVRALAKAAFPGAARLRQQQRPW